MGLFFPKLLVIFTKIEYWKYFFVKESFLHWLKCVSNIWSRNIDFSSFKLFFSLSLNSRLVMNLSSLLVSRSKVPHNQPRHTLSQLHLVDLLTNSFFSLRKWWQRWRKPRLSREPFQTGFWQRTLGNCSTEIRSVAECLLKIRECAVIEEIENWNIEAFNEKEKHVFSVIEWWSFGCTIQFWPESSMILDS